MIVWVVVGQNLDPNSPEFPEVLGVFSSKKEAHDHLWHKVHKHENWDFPEHAAAMCAKFDESIQEWLHSDKVEWWYDYIWSDDDLWKIDPILLDSPHAEIFGCNPAYPERLCSTCKQAHAAWPGKKELT